MAEGQRPLVDPRQLQDLADQTSPETANQFATMYLRMLPDRVDRILQALHPQDAKRALDAALSLRTSSAMNGAQIMEHSCAQLVNALRAGRSHAAMDAGHAIADQLPLLQAVLAERLGQLHAAAQTAPSQVRP